MTSTKNTEELERERAEIALKRENIALEKERPQPVRMGCGTWIAALVAFCFAVAVLEAIFGVEIISN